MKKQRLRKIQQHRIISLSHFVTLLFGFAFGMTIIVAIEELINGSSMIFSYSLFIISLVISALILRVYSIFLFKKHKKLFGL